VKIPMGNARVLGCCSDDVLSDLAGDLQVIGWSGGTTLKASPGEDPDRRRELITSVRGGQHVELAITARTYRQKDGQPNRRGLRFKTSALAELAASFVGVPVLRDHNATKQADRIGTVTSSQLLNDDATGWASFVQVLQIVKPDAVISVLDGTLDRFSIAWVPTGDVICSLHGANRRSDEACGCWPLDVVKVDGLSRVVEFEFQTAEGTEVSCVNVPAVKGTRIDDVRAALAAELDLRPRAAAAIPAPEVAATPASRTIAAPRPTAAPLSPALQNAARILGLTEDAIRQNMVDHGELAESDGAPSDPQALALALDDALEIAAEQLGLTVEQLRANMIEHGELVESGEVLASRPVPNALAADDDNPYLAVAARELGIPIEQLKANAREQGTGA